VLSCFHSLLDGTDIRIDQYASLIELPCTLTASHLLPLQPYTTYTLSVLLSTQTFHIVPESSQYPLKPRELPRERFVQDVHDGYDSFAPNYATGKRKDWDTPTEMPKKKGRPSKRDKAKRVKDALGILDKWLEKSGFTPQATLPPDGDGTFGATALCPTPVTTHVLLSNPPTASRVEYQAQKANFLGSLDMTSQSLQRANQAVLVRMRKIDEMAAEKGLEVGGEGGERTGLIRVERAVAGLANDEKGILGLLEGAGMEDEQYGREESTPAIGPVNAREATSEFSMEVDTRYDMPTE
jgi:hypothetical protein